MFYVEFKNQYRFKMRVDLNLEINIFNPALAKSVL